MDRPISPWVRRALQGRLPVSIAGGASFTPEDEVGVVPATFGPDAWSSRGGVRAAVRIEASDPICLCGETHPGWQHRETPRR